MERFILDVIAFKFFDEKCDIRDVIRDIITNPVFTILSDCPLSVPIYEGEYWKFLNANEDNRKFLSNYFFQYIDDFDVDIFTAPFHTITDIGYLFYDEFVYSNLINSFKNSGLLFALL